jgi:hypothetical protein
MPMTIEDLCSLLPRNAIARLMALQGPLLRLLADHPPGRLAIRHLTHGGLGRISARLAQAAGLLEGRNPVELAMNVMRYYFEPFLEEEQVDAEQARFFLTSCPYGWRTADDTALCDAVMQFERELVAGLGGTLIIEETIPGGAPKCRFTVGVGHRNSAAGVFWAEVVP